MAAVKSANTKPEVALRKALHGAGMRGWRCHYRRAPGTPDIAWVGLRVAVFVDGAFWHGHESRHRPGRSGEYWDRKIAGNVARDRRVDRELSDGGWLVVRVWDFEVRKAREAVVDRIRGALTDRVSKGGEAPSWVSAAR
jgi:DNA mismatch endonuclease (patch repair protein)